jgi:hypothetical protein
MLMKCARASGLTLLLATASLAGTPSPLVEPGQWEMTVTIDSIDMPGAPPMIANIMRGHKMTIRHCITPEEASRGPQDVMKSNNSCAFTRYSAVGGKLSSEMVCKQPGGTMTVENEGTFTPTTFTASGRSVTTGGRAMSTTSTSSGHRIGECN